MMMTQHYERPAPPLPPLLRGKKKKKLKQNEKTNQNSCVEVCACTNRFWRAFQMYFFFKVES